MIKLLILLNLHIHYILKTNKQTEISTCKKYIFHSIKVNTSAIRIVISAARIENNSSTEVITEIVDS